MKIKLQIKSLFVIKIYYKISVKKKYHNKKIFNIIN